MQRLCGDMGSLRSALLVLIVINIVALTLAGPLGPMPNVTSVDFSLKEGSCALGDVVYMAGDEFPGANPCEKCSCTSGGVQCARHICEPRPGCKALHRPDHCCPTYQCECEQEGRVYGNGEKLVDPADPCRVCYCQGGEVVCRRIACFVRDDCTPRLVPGRCCPEYDNCPLRGVTSLPGVSSPAPSISKIENIEAAPAQSKENIKEFTIKEITPVSEIPAITEVKIKEILPSPSIDVAEYSSSKSPLIPREVTSEKNIRESDTKTELPSVIEVHSSASSLEATQFTASENGGVDTSPSRISFSAQDSIHSLIYPSNEPIVATMGVVSVTAEPLPVATTKAPMIEEEDTFDHNPAFPPIPDDLAVLRNHEDEIVPEPIVDNDHMPSHDIVAEPSPSTKEAKKPIVTTTPIVKNFPDTTTVIDKESSQSVPVTTVQSVVTTSSEGSNSKENPMLNLRSAIPTGILKSISPSSIPEQFKGGLHDTTTVASEFTFVGITTTSENAEENTNTNFELSTEDKVTEVKPSSVEITMVSQENKIANETTTPASEYISTIAKEKRTETEVSTEHEQTTSEIAKSNIATEITSQTELSSLPIETSDQNPPAVSKQVISDKVSISTIDPLITSSNVPTISSEVITVSRASSSGNTDFENVETTEFILTSFGSSETATDGVELIKISSEPEKSAAIIDEDSGRKNNALTDLINLVNDMASISDHTNEHGTESVQNVMTTTSISDSEELIPVNAVYKSKNKNFNQNSITETPLKSKNPNTVNKQKIIEIEDDESEGVTDSLPPYDKVEPTTRRPIIDNVSDDNITNNKTNKKDIEIITQSYVPTINRRPTKVVMKKNDNKFTSDEATAVSASSETTTDTITSNETPLVTIAESSASSETSAIIEQSPPTEFTASNAKLNAGTNVSTDPDVTTERAETAQ